MTDHTETNQKTVTAKLVALWIWTGLTIAAPYIAAGAWHGSEGHFITATLIVAVVIACGFSARTNEASQKSKLAMADLKHVTETDNTPPEGKMPLAAHQSWKDPVLPSIRAADLDAASRHAVLLYGVVAALGLAISKVSSYAPAVWIVTFMTLVGITIQGSYGAEVEAAKRNARGSAEGLWVRSGPGTQPETSDETTWYELIPDADVREVLNVMQTRNTFIMLVIVSITLGAFYGKRG